MSDESRESVIFAGTLSPLLASLQDKLRDDLKYQVYQESLTQKLPELVREAAPALILLHMADLNELSNYVLITRVMVDFIKTRQVRVVLFSGKLPDKVIALFEKAGVRDFVPDNTPLKNLAFKVSRLSSALAAQKKQNRAQEERRITGQSKVAQAGDLTQKSLGADGREGSVFQRKEWAMLQPRDALPLAVAVSELLMDPTIAPDELWKKIDHFLKMVLGNVRIDVWTRGSRIRTLGNLDFKTEIQWDPSWKEVRVESDRAIAPLSVESTGVLILGEQAGRLPPPFVRSLVRAMEGLILSG